jgi:Trk K+ transport system NAD-binding subunit
MLATPVAAAAAVRAGLVVAVARDLSPIRTVAPVVVHGVIEIGVGMVFEPAGDERLEQGDRLTVLVPAAAANGLVDAISPAHESPEQDPPEEI